MNNVGASRNLIIVWIFTSFDQPLRNGIFNVNNSQVTEMMVGQDRLMSTFRINEAASINGGMYGCHAYNRELGDAVIANSSVTVFCECVCKIQYRMYTCTACASRVIINVCLK